MPETTTIDAPSEDGPRIALCLSGGGLRATFFHFGTVKALKRTGLLRHVNAIISVSGGSILAAHIAKNWDRYCGSDKDFEALEREIFDLAKRDLRGRILRRWLLTLWTHLLPAPWRMGFVEHLEREYRRLFSKTTIESLYPRERVLPPPDLHILSTNLISGELCSFSKGGYEVERRRCEDGGAPSFLFKSDILRLSFAVAASSAFPPLFPPAKLRRQMLPVKDSDLGRFTPNTHLLSDGGVFDNTGLEKTVRLQARAQLDVNVILLSDAGSPFAWDTDSTFTNIFSRNIRAANILMDRVASATLDKVGVPTDDGKVLCCAINATTDDGPLLHAIQAELPFVRTDLDTFHADEVTALVHHGEHIGLSQLRTVSGSTEVAATKRFAPEVQDRLLARVRNAGRRKWIILNFRDWTTWALLGLSMTCVYAAYAYVAAPLLFATEQLDASAETSNQLVTENGELRAANAILRQRVNDLTEQVGSNPNKRTCRHPSHGVERYAKEFDVTRESGWRGGGFDQPRWCGDLVAMLKGEYVGAEIAVLRSSEDKKNTCSPFICPQYNYSCTAHVKADPIYNERESDACKP